MKRILAAVFCVSVLACAMLAFPGSSGGLLPLISRNFATWAKDVKGGSQRRSLAPNALPTDLFISEYIEGTSSNKAIEIYNGTGAAVNLGTGAYVLQLYSNGATTPQSMNLIGTIANGDVYVIAHPSANAAILSRSDDSNTVVINFNGNDAVVLRKNGVVIDSIGQVGVNPGTEWGTGLQSTADNTLVRNSNVCGGDNNATNTFDPATEWTGFAVDTTSNLGSHTAFCAAPPNLSVNDISLSEGQSGATSFTFTVSLSAPAPAGGVTFDIATADGTAQDDVPGTEDEDYTAAAATGQTIPQGSTTHQFAVNVNGDAKVEPNETFFLNVTNITGATAADTQGVGTIVNDDDAPLNLVVTKNSDTNDGACNSDCSLREAITAANASNGDDTITFALNAGTLFEPVSDLPTIADNGSLTIAGNGAGQTMISGGASRTVLRVGLNATVTISSLTIKNGAGTNGAGVVNDGHLTVMSCLISDNVATGLGGGIYSSLPSASITITGSTISGNGAFNGGGLYVESGPISMTGATVSGNSATVGTGGLRFGQTVSASVKTSTIAFNSGTPVSGVSVEPGGSVSVGGSIIGANVGNGNVPDVAGIFTSGGFNIIGNAGSAAGFVDGVNGDQVGPVIQTTAAAGGVTPLDPKLAPLGDNGGVVPTHAFDNSNGVSPAVDKGTAQGAATDARGLPRTVDLPGVTNAAGGDGTDIGAFEIQAPSAAHVSIQGRVTTSMGRGIQGAIVTLTMSNGNTMRVVTNSFGYFRFTNVTAVESCMVEVLARRFRFTPRFVSAGTNATDLNFASEP